MKISTLIETNTTPATDPVGNQSQQAPHFGRDPKVLETTTSGAVATVSQPIGGMQKRKGKGSMFQGIKTSKKYANSVGVTESKDSEKKEKNQYLKKQKHDFDIDTDTANKDKESVGEAANAAQQAAIAISMKKQGKKPKKVDEVKQRLDAKCWKGKHKEGTKIKGGVRVNNCVPNESIESAQRMRVQDYLDKAEELHKQMMYASKKHDVQEFERLKKVRDELDKQARSGLVTEVDNPYSDEEKSWKRGKEAEKRFQDTERSAGEEEPKGKFTVLARTKTGWKNISSSEGSNKAFRHAQNLANKYQDREFGVRWPNGTINIVKSFKLDESDISEDLIADKLHKELDAILGRAPVKDLSNKPTDKEIGDKPQDKDIVAKENVNDALLRKKANEVYQLLSNSEGDIVKKYGHEVVGDAIHNVVQSNLNKDTQQLAKLVMMNLQRNLQYSGE